MLIDWFTVAAQTLNFLVLVWLLKHFLYKPVLDAIDARESGVAQKLSEAAQKLATADQARAALAQKNSSFDDERAALMSQATSVAQAERERLLAQARTAADALRQQRQQALQSELTDLTEQIVGRARHEVFVIVRKALTDLAGATLEERMTATFIKQLSALPSDAKPALNAALKAHGGPAVVRSVFALAPPERATIRQGLEEYFGAPVAIEFELAPRLVSGIEFSANGYKLAWTIDDYLVTLETNVADAARNMPLTGVSAVPATGTALAPAGATP